MNKLKNNIENSFGEKGKSWLNALPSIVKALSTHWSLSNITPVDNMSWNYVAFAMQEDSYPVVLKISCTQELIVDEYRSLRHFNGRGAINVLAMNEQYHALLLERAIPGDLLKDQYKYNVKSTINTFSQVVKTLASQNRIDAKFSHVGKWCEAIDRVKIGSIASHLVSKAQELKIKLLNTAKDEYVCHGDLHLENIIKQGVNWLAIDPKGIVGEMTFEAAAFNLLNQEERHDTTGSLSLKIIERIDFLSTALEIDRDRLIAWIFLRVIISVQWFIEDNGDESYMLALAYHLYPLLPK